MKIILLALVLLAAGCNEGRYSTAERPHKYVCDSDQLDLVEREMTLCNKTDYLGSYCFSQAKASLCELITTHTDK